MKLLIFGLGYTAGFYAAEASQAFEQVTATKRAPEILAEGRFRLLPFDGASEKIDPRVIDALGDADALLVSAGPDAFGDPVLRRLADNIAAAPKLKTIVYLSTIGVYGDHQGAWIDETSELRPSNDRTRWRVAVERDWLALGERAHKNVYVLRLSGIYGPGRSVIEKLRDGTAKRLIKPGQVFNRIHVADIAQAINACFAGAAPSGVYNVTDDEPAPPQDVVTYAAELLGVTPPPEQVFEATQLSPMARSFYGENKRVANKRMREVLEVTPKFPTYREGIGALA
ncbi:nucleoside-diphosphate-sugar epimerase [Rhodoblastus acidophilus]|uniref:SDR family oxidoreductase n=1 Tax=Rhodoblastus acidophilus TaxID=1074 RepID=UPI002224FA94|nr:SDR family oxidoreductase [Rhodoblastus acidophilus]MCW2282449.1 nucleoside-diphosphate-sugar epimerase [Rhodoblastus acidophilus]MCW2331146.1 nucleoside-diphosphate-sugar epimerase [Rhodoblastus acidophilus]